MQLRLLTRRRVNLESKLLQKKEQNCYIPGKKPLGSCRLWSQIQKLQIKRYKESLGAKNK